MKTIIITITIITLLIVMVSSVEIYAGNSYTFESEQFEYYTTVGNQSNINGMDINWEDGNITISFDVSYKSDNLTIIFFNEKVVTNTVTVGGGSSGGGGTRIIYKDKIIPEIVEKEKIVKVPSDIVNEVEVIKIENKIPIWVIIFIAILIIGIIILLSYLFLKDEI